jgi:hypothetical protein
VLAVVLVASGQLLLDFLLDALLPPAAHAVILGLHSIREERVSLTINYSIGLSRE